MMWDRLFCIDCESADLSGPDEEGFYDCHECGAAWIPGDENSVTRLVCNNPRCRVAAWSGVPGAPCVGCGGPSS